MHQRNPGFSPTFTESTDTLEPSDKPYSATVLVLSCIFPSDPPIYEDTVKFYVREEGTVYSLHSFFRKLAQGVGPSLALVIMVALGYSEINAGNQLFSVALNMRYLVAGLFLFSAVMQFVGLALIYNLDKKKLEQMNSELALRKAEQQ
jgi:Na+/melibiose symporter-like transporter